MTLTGALLAVNDWLTVRGPKPGALFQPINKGGNLTPERMKPLALNKMLIKRGSEAEVKDFSPHDLRRTYAQLGYEAGVPIIQISTLLGHSSVSTTQKYLNLELDLETTVSDFIPLSGD